MASIIDELTILLSADATRANKAVDSLEKKLLKLESVAKAAAAAIANLEVGDLGAEVSTALANTEVKPELIVDKSAFLSQLDDLETPIKVTPDKAHLKSAVEGSDFKLKIAPNKTHLQTELNSKVYTVKLEAAGVEIEGLDTPVALKVDTDDLVTQVNNALSRVDDLDAEKLSLDTLTVKLDSNALVADINKAFKKTTLKPDVAALLKTLEKMKPVVKLTGDLSQLKTQLAEANLDRDITITDKVDLAPITLEADTQTFTAQFNEAVEALQGTVVKVEAQAELKLPKTPPKLELKINQTTLNASIKAATPKLGEAVVTAIDAALNAATFSLDASTEATIQNLKANVIAAIEAGVEQALPTVKETPAAKKTNAKAPKEKNVVAPLELKPDLAALRAALKGAKLTSEVTLTQAGNLVIGVDLTEWENQKENIERDGLTLQIKPTDDSVEALGTSIKAALSQLDLSSVDVSSFASNVESALVKALSAVKVPLAETPTVKAKSKRTSDVDETTVTVRMSPNATFLKSEFAKVTQKIKLSPDTKHLQTALNSTPVKLTVGTLTLSESAKEAVEIPITISESDINAAILAVPITEQLLVPIDTTLLQENIVAALTAIETPPLSLTTEFVTDWVALIEAEKPTVTLKGDITEIQKALSTLQKEKTTAAKKTKNTSESALKVKVDDAEWQKFKADIDQPLPALIVEADTETLTAKITKALSDAFNQVDSAGLQAAIDATSLTANVNYKLVEPKSPPKISVGVNATEFKKSVKAITEKTPIKINVEPTMGDIVLDPLDVPVTPNLVLTQDFLDQLDNESHLIEVTIDPKAYAASLASVVDLEIPALPATVQLTPDTAALTKAVKELKLTATASLSPLESPTDTLIVPAIVGPDAIKKFQKELSATEFTVPLRISPSSIETFKDALSGLDISTATIEASLIEAVRSVNTIFLDVPVSVSSIEVSADLGAVPIAATVKKKEFKDSFKDINVGVKVTANKTHLQKALSDSVYTVNLQANPIELSDTTYPVKVVVEGDVAIPINAADLTAQIVGSFEAAKQSITELIVSTTDAVNAAEKLSQGASEVDLVGNTNLIKEELEKLLDRNFEVRLVISETSAAQLQDHISSFDYEIIVTIQEITEDDLKLPQSVDGPKVTLEPVTVLLEAGTLDVQSPPPVKIAVEPLENFAEQFTAVPLTFQVGNLNADVQAVAIDPIKLVVDAEFLSKQLKSLEPTLALFLIPRVSDAPSNTTTPTPEATERSPSSLSGPVLELFETVQSVLDSAQESSHAALEAQQQALRVSEQQLQVARSRLEELTAASALQTQANAESEATIAKQEAAAKAARQEIEELAAALTNTNKELTAAQETLLKLSTDLEATTADKSKAEAKVEDSNASIEQLKAAIAELKADSSKNDSSTLQQALDKATAENTRLIKSLEKQQASSERREAKATAKAEKLQAKIEGLNTKLKDATATAKEQTKALKAAIKQLGETKTTTAEPEKQTKKAKKVKEEAEVAAPPKKEVKPAEAPQLSLEDALSTVEEQIKSTVASAALDYMHEIANIARLGAADLKEKGVGAGTKIAADLQEATDAWVQLRLVQEIEKSDGKKLDLAKLKTKIVKELADSIWNDEALSAKTLGKVKSDTGKPAASTIQKRAKEFSYDTRTALNAEARKSAQNVMDGLSLGTDEKDALKLGQELGRSIIEGINKGTQSKSPSRAAILAMRNVVDGLIKGKVQYNPGLRQEMRVLGESLIADIKSGVGKAGTIGATINAAVSTGLEQANDTDSTFQDRVVAINNLLLKLKELGRVSEETGNDFVSAGVNPKIFYEVAQSVRSLQSEMDSLDVDQKSASFKKLQRELQGTTKNLEKLETVQTRSQKAQAKEAVDAAELQGADQIKNTADLIKVAATELSQAQQQLEATAKENIANAAEAASVTTRAVAREIASYQRKAAASEKDIAARRKRLELLKQEQEAARERTPTKTETIDKAVTSATSGLEKARIAQQKNQDNHVLALTRLAEKKAKQIRVAEQAKAAEQLQRIAVKQAEAALEAERMAAAKSVEEIKKSTAKKIESLRTFDAQREQILADNSAVSTSLGSGAPSETNRADSEKLKNKRINARAVTGGIQAIAGFASGDITGLLFGLGNALPEIIEQFQDLKDNIESLPDLFGAFGKAAPLAFIAAAGALLPFVVELESLKTKFAAVGLSFESEFGKIKTLAKDLKVDIGALANLKVKIDASLIGTKSTINSDEVTKNVASISRGFGLNENEQERFSTGVTQGFSKSVVSMEELRQQIGEAVPGFMSAMAEAMGMSVQQAMKEIAKGTVSSDFYAEALKVLEERTAGGVEAGKDTIGAAFTDLKNQFTLLANDSMGPLSTGVKAVLNSLTALTSVVATFGATVSAAGLAVLVNALEKKLLEATASASLKDLAVNAFVAAKQLASMGPSAAASKLGGLTSVAIGATAALAVFQIAAELMSHTMLSSQQSVQKFLDELKPKGNKPGSIERGGTGSGLKDAIDFFLKGEKSFSNSLGLPGLLDFGAKTFEQTKSDVDVAQIEKQTADLMRASNDKFLPEVDVANLQAASKELYGLSQQVQELSLKKNILAAKGADVATLKAIDAEIETVQARLSEVSTKSFKFTSVAALEDGVKNLKTLLSGIDADIANKTTSKEAVESLEKQKAYVEDLIKQQENVLHILTQQNHELNKSLDLVRAIASFEDTTLQLDLDAENAQIGLNEIKGKFDKLPAEIGVLEAEINTTEAISRLDALKENMSDVGEALNADESAANLKLLLNTTDLTTVSFEKLAEAEAVLKDANNPLTKDMEELLSKTRDYIGKQKDVAIAQKEVSNAILESKEANNKLLDSLREVLELVEQIKNTFEGAKFEIDLSSIKSEIALLDGPLGKEGVERGKQDLAQRQQKQIEDANIAYQNQLFDTVNTLSDAERQILANMLQGSRLADATFAQMSNALSSIQNQRAKGAGVNANVENALSAGLEARKLDTSIAQAQLAQAQARRAERDRLEDAQREQKAQTEELAKETRAAVKDIGKAVREMAESVRDLLEELGEQMLAINRESHAAARDFRGMQLANDYKQLLGRAFASSPIEGMLTALTSVLEGIEQAKQKNEDVIADTNKKIKNLYRRRDDFVEKGTDDLAQFGEKRQALTKKNLESTVGAGGLTGQESPELIKAELDRLSAVFSTGAEMSEAQMTRLALVYQEHYGTLDSLHPVAMKALAKFRQKEQDQAKIGQDLAQLDAAELKLKQEYNAGLEEYNKGIREAEGAANSLKNNSALREAQELENVVFKFKNSMLEIAESAQETANALQITVKRFSLSGEDFTTQGRPINIGQEQRRARKGVDLQFLERQNEFTGIERQFSGIKTAFDKGEVSEKLREDTLRFAKQFTLSAQHSQEIQEALAKGQNDLELIGKALTPLKDSIEALRPTEGDRRKAYVSVDEDFRLKRAAQSNKSAEFFREDDFERLNSPLIAGNFFAGAQAAKQEIELLQETKENRFKLWAEENTAAIQELGLSAAQAREQFDELDAVKMGNLKLQTQAIQLELGKFIGTGVANFFTDIATGAKSAGEAFADFARGIATSVIQLAAQLLAQAATFIFLKAIGIDISGGGGGGGFAGILGKTLGFSTGGVVGVDGLESPDLLSAMRKEGVGARVAVVHDGERMLSAKTGDAQIFHRLEASGAWDLIKANKGNFSRGGTAGGAVTNAASALSNNRGLIGSGETNITINESYPAITDNRSFSRSRNQRLAQRKFDLDAATRGNFKPA